MKKENLEIQIKFNLALQNHKKKLSLDNCSKFEINNPDAFKQMYQFWVKK